MWNDIVKIYGQQQGHWCFLCGDFNNFIHIKDRIGGDIVTENEYVNLCNMINIAGLFEKEFTFSYYTWSNNHIVGTIYSRINHVLGNVDWLQRNIDTTLTMLPPSVSHHSVIYLTRKQKRNFRKPIFKFYNFITELEGYETIVKDSWN